MFGDEGWGQEEGRWGRKQQGAEEGGQEPNHAVDTGVVPPSFTFQPLSSHRAHALIHLHLVALPVAPFRHAKVPRTPSIPPAHIAVFSLSR